MFIVLRVSNKLPLMVTVSQVEQKYIQRSEIKWK